ncbi:hypothetical protein Slin15195_G044610 [Septoria linicola]|uniref:Uncharacterized protein n=1 Tax=Septoria linicola TaxID=215465 RepID=A0A9Q9AKM2_9PEZI|nr:hypothetical protein Slin14017_G048130 [Septoria linicola]USW51142.1 hypothetical protein Slin15195_G044610 [Septoria linicola]
MASTYDACKQERGNGCIARMHTRLSNSLQGIAPPDQQFWTSDAVLDGLADDIRSQVIKLGILLYTNIDGILKELIRNLQRACQATIAARSPAEKKSRAQLKAKLDENKPRLDAAKTELTAIKKKYAMADDEMDQTEPESFLKSIAKRLGLW